MPNTIKRMILAAVLTCLFVAVKTIHTAPAGEPYDVYLPAAPWQGELTLRHVATVLEPTEISESELGLFVSDRFGVVRNVTTEEVVLDISANIDLGNLLSILVRDNYIYTLYKNSVSLNVSRFPLVAGFANLEDEERLLTKNVFPDGIHHGGDLNFGPDGYLYVSMGDGSDQGDPPNHAQDATELFGSMLRLDVSGAGLPPDCDPAGNYTIPADNPFVDGPGGNCDELWAIGLRQPWRFSFDSQTGDMWIGDVGKDDREEVNFQPAGDPGGQNYGWRCFEGQIPWNLIGCDQNYVFSVYEYEHTAIHCSITGGFVYRGSLLPSLTGRYLFADFCSGEVFVLQPDFTARTLVRVRDATWVTLAEGLDRELYLADFTNGHIYRIEE
jgi:glucose/arabinose dehydrogenase